LGYSKKKLIRTGGIVGKRKSGIIKERPKEYASWFIYTIGGGRNDNQREARHCVLPQVQKEVED
jgi:hypothetical protein